MHLFITGCAGFIGSTVCDYFLSKGVKITGIDNFSTGKEIFLKKAIKNNLFNFIKADLKDKEIYTPFLKNVDLVIHLAANADVRRGLDHPTKDLLENVFNTSNILEAMRKNDVRNIIFSSTGSVYGEADILPTPENCPFPIQTSLYGASKIAAEGLISSYCEGYGFNSVTLRFVSLLGPRYTHGHVFDFVSKLKKDSSKLDILGDGNQDKSYFHVLDCVDAIQIFCEKIISQSINGFNVFNLGTRESIKVKDSAKIICETLKLNPEFHFSGGYQGWIGDNPIIKLDISKANLYGWEPKRTIKSSIIETAIWVNSYLENL